MRALVAVKRVVDYAVKIRIKPDKSAVDTAVAKMSMNPFCEIAVEEGVRLKERGHVKELVAVSLGPPRCAETLRQALAMGADRAIHIRTNMRIDQELQPLAVAKLLQKVVEKEKPNMVLLGKQSIDGDNNQTGSILAGLLGWPQANGASSVKINDDKLSAAVEKEVDEGIEEVHVPLPAVITADLRLNEPRYTTLPNLMKARRKKTKIMQVARLGVDVKPRLEVLSVEQPPERQGGGKVVDVDDLIDKLQTEAGVL